MALNVKGIHEGFKVNRWLEEHYVSKGCVLDDDTRHKVSEIGVSYYDGLHGLSPRASDLYNSKEVEEISAKLLDRIDVLDMIRSDLAKIFEKAGRHLSKVQLREIVQETYREAPEERRRRYKEQYDERCNEQLLRTFRLRGSLP